MNLAIIQARYSSSRLPGKVLKLMHGAPMLMQQIKRLRHSQLIDKLVVATSIESSDDPVALLCEENNVECFRGDLDDVLARFYLCAKKYNAQTIVRLTGDCPLLDPALIDSAIKLHKQSDVGYTSNCSKRFYPDGQDVEVFTFEQLELAQKKAVKPSEREHVTPYIREISGCPQAYLIQEQNWSDYRMSVDHSADFEFASQVYAHLFDSNPEFTLQDIISLLNSKPELLQINQDIEYNEGYIKSLQQDKEQGYS